MIRLFEKDEMIFESLGIGVLKDAIECFVFEELNGAFELEMEYPITGSHYSAIALERIIVAAPNSFDREQPFRIYSISRPLNGRVKVKAQHISYDMSGYIVKPLEAINLQDALGKIQNGTIPESPFLLTTDKEVNEVALITEKPYTQRALLAGQEGSLLDTYRGEYKFDRYNVSLMNNRGEDRGITIRYGKNLTDITDDISSEKLFTGIFPFYSAMVNETTSDLITFYQEVWIVPNILEYSSTWLSLSDGGKSFIPLIENKAVQIKTEGDYYNWILYFKRAEPEVNYFDAYIRTGSTPFSLDWLSLVENGDALIPEIRTIYRIVNPGSAYLYNTYIWSGVEYIEYTGTGFYYRYDLDKIPPPDLERYESGTNTHSEYIDLTTDPELVDGILYMEGMEDDLPKKILNLDLSEHFDSPPTVEALRAKANDYLKNNNLREINNNLTVSFVRLADTSDLLNFKELEIVKLGDWVSVYYERLGVNAKLQIISTDYNVILGSYNELELGKKSATITDNALTAGDDVSSLTNDAYYTTEISVVDLFAKNLTAEYLTGKNAKLSQAQIEQLQVERIEVPGIIEASEAHIDQLMAQLLVAENAEVKNKLLAGEIEVTGTINATAGNIGGCEIQNGELFVSTAIGVGYNPEEYRYNFSVDNEGNVTANSFNLVEDGTYLDTGIGGDPIEVPINLSIGKGRIMTSALFFNEVTKLITEYQPSFDLHTVFMTARYVAGTTNADNYIVVDLAYKDRYGAIVYPYILEVVNDSFVVLDSNGSVVPNGTIESANILAEMIYLDGKIRFVNTEGHILEDKVPKIFNGRLTANDVDNTLVQEDSKLITASKGIIAKHSDGVTLADGFLDFIPDVPLSKAVIRLSDTGLSLFDSTKEYDVYVDTDGNPLPDIAINMLQWDSINKQFFINDTSTSELNRINIGNIEVYRLVPENKVTPTDIEVVDDGNGYKLVYVSATGIRLSGSPPVIFHDGFFGITSSRTYFYRSDGLPFDPSTADIWTYTINYKDAEHPTEYASGGIQISRPRKVSGSFVIHNELGTEVDRGDIKLYNALDQVLTAGNVKYHEYIGRLSYDLETNTLNLLDIEDEIIPNNKIIVHQKSLEFTQGVPIVFDSNNIVVPNGYVQNIQNPNAIVWNELKVDLRFQYWHASLGPWQNTVEITIPAGTRLSRSIYKNSLGSAVLFILPPGSAGFPPKITPSQVVETTGDPGQLLVNTSFAPSLDGYYSLGGYSNRWDDIYAVNGTIETSDKNQKEEISYDISGFDILFDDLKPVSYRFKDGSSGRTHLGLIAQDVEESLNKNNIPSKNFAGLIKSVKKKSRNKEQSELTNDDYEYGLRYSELHAMEIDQIQKLKKEINELKQLLKKEE